MMTGCAGTYESSVRGDLTRHEERFEAKPSVSTSSEDGTSEDGSPTKAKASRQVSDGTLGGYVALALENNPEIEAAFERWQASVHRISESRRLPNPMLGFGYYIRSVETRVGPQQARFSLQQTFPWPTKLSAGADAASAQSRAMQRQFDAAALGVAQRVALAYWNLWQIRATRETHRQHLDVLRGLSESVRARVATGTATLAELQQIDLTMARLDDNIAALDEAELVAEARLREAVGLTGSGPLPTTESPGLAAPPAVDMASLIRSAQEHPAIESRGLLAESKESSARSKEADRWPSFTVGADWIITGEARMPNVQDSGKDAIVVSGGIQVPLWQGSYSDSVAAVRAEAQAERAEQRALRYRAEAAATSAISDVRDAVRRVKLYRGTLVPQAESAYESVLGAYTVGRGTVAQMLLAQRDLLDLRVELDRARADYVRAWARLEEVTARELRRARENSGDHDD